MAHHAKEVDTVICQAVAVVAASVVSIKCHHNVCITGLRAKVALSRGAVHVCETARVRIDRLGCALPSIGVALARSTVRVVLALVVTILD